MTETTSPASSGRTFFGHPMGLATLFFTEFWERFSYYGMRALLVLFMTDTLRGGMGLDDPTANAIYGLYVFGVYVLALPGGWIADRLVGQRRAVLIGGIIIALGHFTLAIHSDIAFFSGLALIVIGTGLLKPNVSSVVADLYPEGGARRDQAFSIFYMGINLGAFLGPLLCGWLGESDSFGWHWGFAAAGVGMTAGLIQYVYGSKHMGQAGFLKGEAADATSVGKARNQFLVGVVVAVVAIGGFVALAVSGTIPFELVQFAENLGYAVLALTLIYFAAVIFFVCRDGLERARVGMIFVLVIGAALFWSGFEQAGTSMNLFAERYTDRTIMGWEMPTSWLQSVNPIFIILLAPVIGSLWVRLGARNPSIPVKFGMGLALLGAGFFVLAWGAQYVDPNGSGVSPAWLVMTYFFHTVGELCLSPVGLSSITKLSPTRIVSQMMGMWFVGASIGNLIAGLVAGRISQLPQDEVFAGVATFSVVAGVVFLLLAKPLGRLAKGVK